MSQPRSYRVDAVAPDDVRADLLRVWKDNLRVRGAVEAKFDWLYRLAPRPANRAFVLRAPGDEERPIVGAAGFSIRPFQVGGQVIAGAVMSDLAVDKAHRSALPAMSLIRTAKEDVLREFPFAYGFPNRFADMAIKRAGYLVLGSTIRYGRPLRHVGYLRKAVPLPVLAPLMGALLDGARLLSPAVGAALALRRWRLEWVTDFDERFDRLWDVARRDHQVVAVRDAAFLRWRFLASPAGRYRIAVLARRDAARSIAAYAIIEDKEGVAHVRDLFGERDAYDSMITLLLPALFLTKAASVSFQFLTSPHLIALAERHGLVRRPEEGRNVVIAGGEPAAGGATLPRDLSAWHITDADDDT